jgi:hypothetical protein
MMGGARVVLVVCVLAASAVAQMPAAAPDTAVVLLSWSDADRAIAAVSLWPDSLIFGDEAVVILDLEPGAQELPPDSVQVDVPWLEPVLNGPDVDLVGLPVAAGLRQQIRYRVYREGPWRVAWGDGPPSAVQMVQGRVDDPAAVEPVRDPRVIGGLPRWVLALLVSLAVVLAVLAAWWRLRRRRQRWSPAFPALAPPAWLETATALRALDQDALLGRERLDGLATVLRRYLEGRFFLEATEMTAPEIAAAARRAGRQAPVLAAFADLVGQCDDARYRPDHVGSQQVIEAMQRALDLIEEVRVQPRWTPVPADRVADAQAAWALLRQRYPAAERNEGRPAC